MGRVGCFHKNNPDRLLWSFIVFSAALHLFLIIFGGRFWSSKSRTEPIEITVRSNEPAKRIIPKPPVLAALPETLRQVVPLKPLPIPFSPVNKALARAKLPEKVIAGIPAMKNSKRVPPNTATKPEKEATSPTIKAEPNKAEPKAEPSARENYFRTVRMLVEQQKRYPKPAKLRKFQGKVIIECVLAPSGEVNSIRIDQGSSFGILDRAAVKAIEDAAPFPKPPPGLFSEDGVRLKIALVYKLI